VEEAKVRRKVISVLIALVLVVSACSSDSGSSDPDPVDAGQQSTGSTSPPPDASSGDQGGNNSGFPPGGDGTYVIDGESFDATVYRCEPFTAPGSQPDDRELSVLAFRGGSEGLEVEIGIGTGFSTTGGNFERQILRVFHSRSGDSGLEQFEGSASEDAEGAWFEGNEFTTEGLEPLGAAPVTIDGSHVTGGPLTLEQTWPQSGTEVVVVESWDLTVPDEIFSDC
jgi:hypothetical protein